MNLLLKNKNSCSGNERMETLFMPHLNEWEFHRRGARFVSWCTFIRNWNFTRFSKPVLLLLGDIHWLNCQKRVTQGRQELLFTDVLFRKQSNVTASIESLQPDSPRLARGRNWGPPRGTSLLHLAYECFWRRGHCHTTGPLLPPSTVYPAPGYFCVYEIE